MRLIYYYPNGDQVEVNNIVETEYKVDGSVCHILGDQSRVTVPANFHSTAVCPNTNEPMPLVPAPEPVIPQVEGTASS